VDLIEPPPEPEKLPEPKAPVPDYRSAPPADLVTVLATGDSGLIAIAKSLLQSAGMPFLVRGEAGQDLFGVGRIFGSYNFITGPIEMQVRAEDAEDARLVLEDLLGSQRAERR